MLKHSRLQMAGRRGKNRKRACCTGISCMTKCHQKWARIRELLVLNCFKKSQPEQSSLLSFYKGKLLHLTYTYICVVWRALPLLPSSCWNDRDTDSCSLLLSALTTRHICMLPSSWASLFLPFPNKQQQEEGPELQLGLGKNGKICTFPRRKN